MQLAFCIYDYFPFGGLQRDFLQVAKASQARGHAIRIYVRKWQGEIPSQMEIVNVPSKGFTNHSRNHYYADWVLEHLRKYPVDVIVGFNKMPGLDIYFAGDTCFAAKAARKGFFYRHSSRCKHYLVFEDAVFANDKKTQIMALTKQQIADFQTYYHTDSARFHLLPPGIAMDRKYSPEAIKRREQFRQNNQIQLDDFVIVQIGSDFKRKGVDRTLLAIAALPIELQQKVVYLVIGQDDPAPYQKIAKMHQIDDRVRFYAGRNDVPDFLFAADLLLHPARQEAAGMVLVEALAAGVPVIVSGVSGYAYHIADANAGVVLPEPYEQKQLNCVLEQAIKDRQQRMSWQQNAINYGERVDLYHLADRAADIIVGTMHHE